MKSNTDNVRKNVICGGLKKLGIFLLILVIVFVQSGQLGVAYATTTTGTEVSVTIDYLEETAFVSAGSSGSTKLYISTDNQKNWELIDPTGVVDLSSILQTKDVTIYFKGNKDTQAKGVMLKGENKDLKVTYTVFNGEGKVDLNIGTGVIYRKGVDGIWKTATPGMSTTIYELKGATLYFRLQATSYSRAGKVVSLKIPKRPTAPSVKLDGSKLSITGLKAKETQYRIGDNTTWTTFLPTDTKSKSIDLSTLIGTSSISNIALPAGVIELRTIGSVKKATSAVKVIEVAAQRIVPDAITVSGSTISISDTVTTNVYEYTKVERNAIFNMATAKWTAIPSKKSAVVPKIAIGDKVLVRLKSITDSKTKQIIIASTYKEFTISSLTTSTK